LPNIKHIWIDKIKSKDGNNIESEESIRTNKIPNRFAGLNHPCKSFATPTFIFFLMFCLHGVFFLKITQIEDWSLFTGLIHNVNLVFHGAEHVLFALTIKYLDGSWG
jgi:hypothetical protein